MTGGIDLHALRRGRFKKQETAQQGVGLRRMPRNFVVRSSFILVNVTGTREEVTGILREL